MKKINLDGRKHNLQAHKNDTKHNIQAYNNDTKHNLQTQNNDYHARNAFISIVEGYCSQYGEEIEGKKSALGFFKQIYV